MSVVVHGSPESLSIPVKHRLQSVRDPGFNPGVVQPIELIPTSGRGLEFGLRQRDADERVWKRLDDVVFSKDARERLSALAFRDVGDKGVGSVDPGSSQALGPCPAPGSLRTCSVSETLPTRTPSRTRGDDSEVHASGGQVHRLPGPGTSARHPGPGYGSSDRCTCAPQPLRLRRCGTHRTCGQRASVLRQCQRCSRLCFEALRCWDPSRDRSLPHGFRRVGPVLNPSGSRVHENERAKRTNTRCEHERCEHDLTRVNDERNVNPFVSGD